MTHCKPRSHLDVVTAPRRVHDQRVGEWAATYVSEFACDGAGHYHGPVVLVCQPHRPHNGLHLLPDAARWLPTALRTAAAEAGSEGAVSILHTINGEFRVWRSFQPGATMALADSVETAAKDLP